MRELSESVRCTDGRVEEFSGHAVSRLRSQNDAFTAVLSHELRNCLGAIRNATRAMSTATSADSAALKSRLLIERQVAQMTRLVDDLLEPAQVQGDRPHLRRERIDLRTVVAHAAQTVELTMQQRNHRMTASIPDAPLWVHADSSRLEQVFVNLLVNAAKYTEPGGDVGVSLEGRSSEAVVRIRDTGIGIASDLLPHVFELFVQGDRSPRRTEAGLGIGLAVVRNLVVSHGGRVTATSAGSRQGSEFTVRLPMCKCGTPAI